MVAAILARLQTGSIPNVVRYGEKATSSPYVCVKPEAYPIGRAFRVIAHYDVGETEGVNHTKLLDLYVFNELPALLSNWSYVDEYGNYVTVKDAKEYTDIVADNDDDTISMERIFYIPLIL